MADTVTVEEAAKMLGVGRDVAYRLARQGEIAGVKVLRVGNRLVIPRRPLERVLSGEEARSAPTLGVRP